MVLKPYDNPLSKPVAATASPLATSKSAKSRKKKPIQPSERIREKQHLHIQMSSAEALKSKPRPYLNNSEGLLYSELEAQLMKSIDIEEHLRLNITRRIMAAYKLKQFHVPVMAFLVSHEGVEFIEDFKLLTTHYELEYMKEAREISEKQLSLDLTNYQKEYGSIVSVILYLKHMQPPLAYVISKQRISLIPRPYDLFIPDGGTGESETTTTTTVITTTITTTTAKKNVTSLGSDNLKANTSTAIATLPPPTFIERLYLNYTRETVVGHYYLIYIDLPLTAPETK